MTINSKATIFLLTRWLETKPLCGTKPNSTPDDTQTDLRRCQRRATTMDGMPAHFRCDAHKTKPGDAKFTSGLVNELEWADTVREAEQLVSELSDNVAAFPHGEEA